MEMSSPGISTILAKHDPPHLSPCLFKKLLFKWMFIYLFIFGCAGPSLLHLAFLWLGSVGFSLQWLLLLWIMGSGGMGFSSCILWAVG